MPAVPSGSSKATLGGGGGGVGGLTARNSMDALACSSADGLARCVVCV